jgi:hypothetical protein
MKTTNAGKYKMRGRELLNGQNRRIAIMSGESIYDASNRRIGEIRGDDLLDSNGQIMISVRDGDIYDSYSRKIARLSEIHESIEGATEVMLRVALWYCFVR